MANEDTNISKSLNRRDFLKAAGACASAIPFIGCDTQTSEPPNILVILTDDQGWGDLALHGNSNLDTPSIDSIGEDGALFERFFVCPVCAPTRAEFLTGRYHPRCGVSGVTRGTERMNLDEKTIADTFKEAGYTTAAYGKWHNGTQYPYHPNTRGFDDFYGFCSGHWGNYFDPILDKNGEVVRGNGYMTDDLTDHALQFIERNMNQSFFCYLPLNIPHSPFQVPDNFYEKFKDHPIGMRSHNTESENLDTTRCALAMCENIDWNVGRVLNKLDDLHLSDNTIIVYFSDNGPNGWRWNGNMKGIKGSTDEGGVRVPCLIRWSGHIKPKTVIPQISGAIDLMPTLADMAGISIVDSKPLDGISLKPLLLDETTNWPDRMIFTQWGRRISVRTQQYRLDNEGNLFDMISDPGQTNDISIEKPDVTTRLTEAVARWREEVLPEFSGDDRPFPVGYSEFPTTQLPARDGIPNGNIQRSSRHPNCSFFTNWTSEDDSMTWDIDVVNSDEYEAIVYYTCAQENIGSTIELSFNGSKLQSTVPEAHNPPLMGAENDRYLRAESYIKDFRPLRLGTIRLEKGRGELTLLALNIHGHHVMDVRTVILNKLNN